ncbi:hypothetical protein CEP54_013418 [Fusarium duplospermum]|uniref:Protein kinase domain-containing protein n=1 Tax=Fusarium duplospermum TaxID=1325734 RepID=A0A428P2Y2_9HYPO|nr:hypothetical protein CEP54_013418 [Fusarium duplospermum]
MDSFSPTASSFSSFAFAQAGAFLFQFNPETDEPVFADPDLLPELRNLRLAHSLIREALEKSPDEEPPLLSDILEDLALYTNAVHRCSATARHLLLQNDPRFLKDARVISHIQTWLGVSSGGLDFGRLSIPLDSSETIALHNWLHGNGELLWYTSTDNDKSRKLGLAVAGNLTRFHGSAFVGYTPVSQPSRQLELVDLLCCLLGQVLEPPQCLPSAVLKGWFLTHRENRPSQQDAYRIFLNELQQEPEPYLIFDGLDASKGQMEALQPMFENILQTGCKLFIICPFPLPAQLNTESAAQITEATIAETILPFNAMMGTYVPLFGSSMGLSRPDFCRLQLAASDRESQNSEHERTQWDAMLRRLTDDTNPVVRVSVKMLVWLVFALDRLSMDEIKTATADDANVSSPVEHMKRLEDFVNLFPGNHEVDLKAPAMRPFLQRKLRDGEGIHADGPHALIAERCLSYIHSVCNLGKLPEDNDELEEWISRHPLLRYASTFWGQHARQVIPASDQHISLLATLLESRHAEEMCALMFSRSEEDTKRHKGAYKGMTGLHLASAFGLVNVVSQMIQSGKFSPCLRTDDGWTALHWAIERFHPDVVTFLLTLPNTESLLACKTSSEGCTALHFAVKNCSSSMVEAMLKAKIDVNAQDRLGRTSLYLAVWSGQEDVVEQLLSDGADPNIRSIYGTTLHCAVKRGTLDLIRTLISASGHRIDLNIKDILPLTALQEAQARGRDDVAAILLEAGAKSSPGLILTQAYFMGSHQGLSAKEGWQGYEVDSEISAQIKFGNQCTCHVLKSCKQEPRQAEAQVNLKHESEDDLTAPTSFPETFDLAHDPHGQVQKYLLSEWRILFKLRHPHIVRYIDSDEDPHRNEFLLYMEYCDRGDLESFHGVQLKDLVTRENKRYGFVEGETTSKLRPLTGVEVWAMIWQMASALAYLHYGLVIRRKNGLYDAALEGPWTYIIHRDVKPANRSSGLQPPKPLG